MGLLLKNGIPKDQYRTTDEKSILSFAATLARLPFVDPYYLSFFDISKYACFVFSVDGEMVFKDTEDGRMLEPLLTSESSKLIQVLKSSCHRNNRLRSRVLYSLSSINNLMGPNYRLVTYERISTPHFILEQKGRYPEEEFFCDDIESMYDSYYSSGEERIEEARLSWNLFSRDIKKAFRDFLYK